VLSLLLINCVMKEASQFFRYYKKTRIVSYWVYTNFFPCSSIAHGYSKFITLIFDRIKMKENRQKLSKVFISAYTCTVEWSLPLVHIPAQLYGHSQPTISTSILFNYPLSTFSFNPHIQSVPSVLYYRQVPVCSTQRQFTLHLSHQSWGFMAND
jgi:hypothetical protein